MRSRTRALPCPGKLWVFSAAWVIVLGFLLYLGRFSPNNFVLFFCSQQLPAPLTELQPNVPCRAGSGVSSCPSLGDPCHPGFGVLALGDAGFGDAGFGGRWIWCAGFGDVGSGDAGFGILALGVLALGDTCFGVLALGCCAACSTQNPQNLPFSLSTNPWHGQRFQLKLMKEQQGAPVKPCWFLLGTLGCSPAPALRCCCGQGGNLS